MTHPTLAAAPINAADRITNLDTVRGIATLGILLMNVVSFGLVPAAYFNIDAGGSDTWFDRTIGLLGEVFIDQKTMALFSLLFGVGICVFADRAAEKGRRSVVLSLWRNLLLFGIGVLHALLWDGDILTVYAICAPVLLLMRNLSARVLGIVGTLIVVGSALLSFATHALLDGDYSGLGSIWFSDGGAESDLVGVSVLSDFLLRSLGMMLIGVALYRADIVQGQRSPYFYRAMVRWGLGIGLPLATIAVVVQQANEWDPSTAFIGWGINTLATPMVAVGYLGVITRWNQRPTTRLHERVRAVGRMALTNYLSQTVLGVLVLRVAVDQGTLGRLTLVGFVVVVWALQLAWSKPWLDRFRFGPIEWLWRMVTYRSWQPIRRDGRR